MLPMHIGLVSANGSADPAWIARIAAALQRQVTRDFSPIWGVTATVDAFDSLADLPIGYWPIVVLDDIQRKEESGFHLSWRGLPYALVKYSDSWSLVASHEMLEMLANPFGSHTYAALAPDSRIETVEYLVEICDPCQAHDNSYVVDGIMVSDFITPHYYDAVGSAGVRYSFRGNITQPREVLPGGYVSFRVQSGEMNEFSDNVRSPLGRPDAGVRSLRAWVDERTTHPYFLEGVPPEAESLQDALSMDKETRPWRKDLADEIEEDIRRRRNRD
jgi:hypothetical protein